MTHDMREDIRYYLESMALDFKVGGLLKKNGRRESKTFTNCCRPFTRKSESTHSSTNA